MNLVGYADYPDQPETPDYGECDGCGCVRDLGDLAKVMVAGEVKRYCRDCEPEEGGDGNENS